jgi:hypothetical protein
LGLIKKVDILEDQTQFLQILEGKKITTKPLGIKSQRSYKEVALAIANRKTLKKKSHPA